MMSSSKDSHGQSVAKNVRSGMDPKGKYRPYLSYLPVNLNNRSWPNREITRAPIWCSVDLRDGNQALINPMDLERKVELFQLLLAIGFKQIEVGFPSANDVEYEFTRHLIEQQLIPDDVTIQVLTQARGALIRRTFEAIRGAKSAVVHVYNPTSELQRRIVFRTDAKGVCMTAVAAVRLIRELADNCETRIVLEYSPESFTGTEMNVARDVCNAVIDAWSPYNAGELILNLPATVEMSTPNVYADQIEWFCGNIRNRQSLLISVHTHNDRGTAVAATELALLAGADRVEGTLFGNGERTGNVDIVTLALNMYSQGIDSQLDFRSIQHVADVASRCTRLPIHDRHPYVGRLVFTAFSGSHQFAIDRGLLAQSTNPTSVWSVPYLPIDPSDIGRDYTADAIRINNQSGAYGVAHVLRTRYGWHIPKELGREFTTQIVKPQGGEDITDAIGSAFHQEYVARDAPYRFIDLNVMQATDSGQVQCNLIVELHGERVELEGRGVSALAACRQALLSSGCEEFEIQSCHKHSTNLEPEPQSIIAYVQIEAAGHKRRFGVGIDVNANRASAKALISALNRVDERRTYRRPEFKTALESHFHCKIPADMTSEFEFSMDAVADKLQDETQSDKIWECFLREFVASRGPFEFVSVEYSPVSQNVGSGIRCRLQIKIDGVETALVGTGGGTIEACANALQSARCPAFGVDGYHAYSLGETADAQGIAFIRVRTHSGTRRFGAGIDKDTAVADTKALVSALNRTMTADTSSNGDRIHSLPGEFGCIVPADLQREFMALVRTRADKYQNSLGVDQWWSFFRSEFVDRNQPFAFRDFRWSKTNDSDRVHCELVVDYEGEQIAIKGSGVGILDACKDALIRGGDSGRAKCPTFRLLDFEEHSMDVGTDARAIAYIPIELDGRGIKYGVGIDQDATLARIKALLAAVNRSFSKLEYTEQEMFADAMRTEFGFELPEDMYSEFSSTMKELVAYPGATVSTADIWSKFSNAYMRYDKPYGLINAVTYSDAHDGQVELCELTVEVGEDRHTTTGRGRNVTEACRDALCNLSLPEFEIIYYGDHALHSGAEAETVSYVQIEVKGKQRMFGVGIDSNPDSASIKAIICALNRSREKVGMVLPPLQLSLFVARQSSSQNADRLTAKD